MTVHLLLFWIRMRFVNNMTQIKKFAVPILGGIIALFSIVVIVIATTGRNDSETTGKLNKESTEAAEENIGEIVTSEAAAELDFDWKWNSAAGLEAMAVENGYLDETIDEKIEQIATGQLSARELLGTDEEYGNFAIADVNNYVNVRSEPNTEGEIVAKMYDGAVAQVQEIVDCEDGEWLSVISGNATGYIKAEYFIYGKDAADVIEDYVDKYAQVICTRLNIRQEPDVESKRVGYALDGEKLKIENDEGEWIKVNYGDKSSGYVSAEFVTVKEEYIYAKTIEEEAAERAANEELLARKAQNEAETPENIEIARASQPQDGPTYTATGSTKTDLVNFALQYVGHPYVHGGNSLENGTDCSGFTSLVYAQFGYGISRTPGGQLSSNGRSVSLDEIQPGDIVCYGSGRCTHVALYIGNGQIVHAANPRKGIVTQNVGYDNILGVKRVIE